MKLYTVQLAQHRLCARLNIPLLDTTVKSGDPVFAPSWEIVMGHKNGTLSDEGYSAVYDEMMRTSVNRLHRARWLEVCRMEQVAIACYCARGKFCHRLLLKPMFAACCRHHGIVFEDMGELGPAF